MTDDEAKKAIVLNYSLMCGSIGNEIQEKVRFIQRFFATNKELLKDDELNIIAQKFYGFISSFKEFDTTVNNIGGRK